MIICIFLFILCNYGRVRIVYLFIMLCVSLYLLIVLVFDVDYLLQFQVLAVYSLIPLLLTLNVNIESLAGLVAIFRMKLFGF